MSSDSSPAARAWLNVLKLRKHLNLQLEKLRAESDADVSRFEVIDGLLQKFRLACVQTIFLDFEYSVAQSTEEALWGLHFSVHVEYRQALARPKADSRPVERRKAERAYHNFLRIASKFYQGYIQRLSARYDVQELKRVAQGIDVEHMEAQDIISPVSEALSRMVLKSCHSTLIHLGDLARYWFRAHAKGKGYDKALAYYGLAHQLMPGSGLAFHQTGIVNQDQANHLDVVYNFYRAWVAEEPHPNAKSNLEAKFRTLRLPNAARVPAGPSSAADVLNTWFAKLHAFYYKAEPFSQQNELENEVMHRLEMACKHESISDNLLKMALVNISAHHVASKVLEEEMENATCFRDFTLRFNALFILTFCRALQAHLEDAVSNNSEGPSDGKPIEISSAAAHLLPTLRVYCAWVAIHREELLKPSDLLHAIVPVIMQHLVRVFTLLCPLTYVREGLDSSPYLLSEDVEVSGHSLLCGDGIPAVCRLDRDGKGNAKPHLYNPSQRLDQTSENLARVLDILRCAYFLVEDGSTPVTCQVTDGWLVFDYQSAGTPRMSLDGTRDTVAPSQRSAEKQPVEEQPLQEQAPGLAAKPVEMNARVAEPIASAGPAAPNAPLTGPTEALDGDIGGQFSMSGDDPTGRTVLAMLTPFLKPPQYLGQQPQVGPVDQGWQRSAATPASGRLSLSSQTSPTSRSSFGSVPPLPWAWDHLPKPGSAYWAEKEAFDNASRGYSPMALTTTCNTPEDPLMNLGQDSLRGSAGFDSLDDVNKLIGRANPSHPGEMPPSFTRGGVSGASYAPGCVGNGAHGQDSLKPRVSHFSGSIAPSPASLSFSHPSSLYNGTPADFIGLVGNAEAGRGEARTSLLRGFVPRRPVGESI